jgi:hypothetical protein
LILNDHSKYNSEGHIRKNGFYYDLFDKNAMKKQENGGITLLESRSVPVQDEAYFQFFWPSNTCLDYSWQSCVPKYLIYSNFCNGNLLLKRYCEYAGTPLKDNYQKIVEIFLKIIIF